MSAVAFDNFQPMIHHWLEELTSCMSAASFLSPSPFPFPLGSAQLLVFHHHLRILAPTPCPLKCDAELKALQPATAKVQTMPWASGMKSCKSISRAVAIPSAII